MIGLRETGVFSGWGPEPREDPTYLEILAETQLRLIFYWPMQSQVPDGGKLIRGWLGPTASRTAADVHKLQAYYYIGTPSKGVRLRFSLSYDSRFNPSTSVVEKGDSRYFVIPYTVYLDMDYSDTV